MLQYKAGYKFVEGGVHAQVLDFPAAITCADSLEEARRLLGVALVDAAETALEMGLACYASHLAGKPVALPLVERALRVPNR